MKLVGTSMTIVRASRTDSYFRCQGANHPDNFTKRILGIGNSKCKEPEGAAMNSRKRKKIKVATIE